MSDCPLLATEMRLEIPAAGRLAAVSGLFVKLINEPDLVEATLLPLPLGALLAAVIGSDVCVETRFLTGSGLISGGDAGDRQE